MRCHHFDSTIIQWKLIYRSGRGFSEALYLVDPYQSRKGPAFHSTPTRLRNLVLDVISPEKLELKFEQGDGRDGQDWWLPSNDNEIDWL
jgi:hypothetical protein